jgi:signal peptidase I
MKDVLDYKIASLNTHLYLKLNVSIMSIYQWVVFFLFIQLVHFLGTWKFYVAGQSWEAAIPVYNAIILMKIIAPYVVDHFTIYSNYQFDYVSYHIRNIKKFWKRTLDTFLGIATCGLYVYYVNYNAKINPHFRSFSQSYEHY